VTLPDEATLKALALEHCRRVNAADLEGLLKLYALNVRFEYPVGAGERIGHGALRSHAGGAMAAGEHDEPGEAVAAPDGRHAAVPVTATMNYLPNGPIMVRHGVLTPPADPRTARIELCCVMVIEARARRADRGHAGVLGSHGRSLRALNPWKGVDGCWTTRPPRPSFCATAS
jgi:steroid delta-isomerase